MVNKVLIGYGMKKGYVTYCMPARHLYTNMNGLKRDKNVGKESSPTRKFYMINGCISHPMHKLDRILSLSGGACGTHRSARLADSQGVKRYMESVHQEIRRASVEGFITGQLSYLSVTSRNVPPRRLYKNLDSLHSLCLRRHPSRSYSE